MLMQHAHFLSSLKSWTTTNSVRGGKCPLNAKAHSLTVHYQDQQEQKKRERGIPIRLRESIYINVIISKFREDLACKAKEKKGRKKANEHAELEYFTLGLDIYYIKLIYNVWFITKYIQ